jgi:AraC family transcriptional regulator
MVTPVGKFHQTDFPSARAFYEATYGQSIVSACDLGVAEAGILHCKQGAGDWSDAATPDLVINVSLWDHAPARVDLGQGRFRYSGRRGIGIAVAPGAATQIHVDGPHEIAMLHVPYRRLLDLAPDAGLPDNGDFGAAHAGELVDPIYSILINRMLNECEQGSPSGPLFVEGAMLMMAAALMKPASQASGPATGGLAPWQIRRSVEHLRSNLTATVSLSDLASGVGLSPFHFARAFKKSTGTPPHRYLVRLRIERACDLLARTGMSVSEIALEVGYESSQSLARAFVAELGVNPSRWRREWRA